jgi:ketosteroid isomerase-like protein
MSDEQQIRALIEVAFAYALLRCGTAAELARDPERRLRLTLGLRKTGGHWIVAHEHHSFSDTAGPDATPSSNVVRS